MEIVLRFPTGKVASANYIFFTTKYLKQMAHTINTTKCIHRINVAEVRQRTPDVISIR